MSRSKNPCEKCDGEEEKNKKILFLIAPYRILGDAIAAWGKPKGAPPRAFIEI